MFRKILIAFAATASLGTAALIPTAASAGWHGGHHGHHGGWHGGPRFGVGFYGPGPGYYGDCVLQRRLVRTPWGPKWRLFRVCY